MSVPSLHRFVIDRLLESRGHWRRIAKEIGLPYSTLGNIANKTVKDPGIKSIEPLALYFIRRDRMLAKEGAKVLRAFGLQP